MSCFIQPPTVLVIDDDPAVLELVRRILQVRFRVQTYPCVEKALDRLFLADLVISDFQMPGLGGPGLVELLEHHQGLLPLLIISGLDPFGPELEKVRDREIPILRKPFNVDDLLRRVHSLLSVS